jgi:hypothetical protein
LQISRFIQVLSSPNEQNSFHGQTGPQRFLSIGANHATPQHLFVPMPSLRGRRLLVRMPGSNRRTANICRGTSLCLRRWLRLRGNAAQLHVRLTLVQHLNQKANSFYFAGSAC